MLRECAVTTLDRDPKKDREPTVRLTLLTSLGRLGPAAKAASPVLHDVPKTHLASCKDTDLQGVRSTILRAWQQEWPPRGITFAC